MRVLISLDGNHDRCEYLRKGFIRWLKRNVSLVKTFTQIHIIGQWYSCIQYMNSEDRTDLIPKFLDDTNKLDNLRNEKCLDAFPELKSIFS
jgi:hypothetical protein